MTQWQSRDKSALIFCCLSPENQQQKTTSEPFSTALRGKVGCSDFPTKIRLSHSSSAPTPRVKKDTEGSCQFTVTNNKKQPQIVPQHEHPGHNKAGMVVKCSATTQPTSDGGQLSRMLKQNPPFCGYSAGNRKCNILHFLFLHRCAVTKMLSVMLSLKKKTSERHPQRVAARMGERDKREDWCSHFPTRIFQLKKTTWSLSQRWTHSAIPLTSTRIHKSVCWFNTWSPSTGAYFSLS